MAKYIVTTAFTTEMPFVGGTYNPNRPKKIFSLGEEIDASEKPITDTSLTTKTLLISSDGFVIPRDKVRLFGVPQQAAQKFIFTKDIVVNGMPNVPEGTIVTQQMRHFNAKKGDIIEGIIDDSPKGKIVRGVAGGLKVQVPFDAVEPMDKTFTDGSQNGTNTALKTSASKPSIFTPENIFIGAAAFLVVFGILKWQKVI